jgi:hypothetical protein
MDQLVRRIFPRNDVDLPQVEPRSGEWRRIGGKRQFWLEQAVRYTTPLAPRQHDRDVHDLGFIFMSTYYRWYRLTQDPKLKEALIQAGKTESLRFKENGQYLRSFVGENSLFIDIMMNVGIIFYAARETGDRRLRDIALRHCLTTRRNPGARRRLHGAGGIFDLQTGEFLRQSTQQGYRGDSCWSRGSAGRCTVSAFRMNTAAIRAFWKPPKPAPITTSRIATAMAFRPGILMRRPNPGVCSTLPPPPSPLPDCCACAACCRIR